MGRPIRVTINLSEDMKAEVDRAARDDHRTTSSLIQLALIQYLAAKGYKVPDKEQ